ncbi:MAG TPA: CotH kinase family protein [Gemmatales bacterium]|nr:CotH kinase family protein [Gemmatales bacterium]
MMRHGLTLLVVLLHMPLCFAQLRTTPSKPDASNEFFGKGMIPKLKIEISKEEQEKLKQKDRDYVRCTIIEDEKTRYENVGIHLKGAAGSFRPIEDRPALTLSFDKFKKNQHFHDLDKLHLNNSVQDGSFMTELLCGELFLANHVPTPRTTHARVWLNGRDLGFYVLKEGFNKAFLRRYFETTSGNLYDGGFLQEIDGDLKRITGDGPNDRSDLKAIAAACREPDPEKRWKRVEELVDINTFITFMALEHMTCHWDGYCQQRNNYKVYIDSKSRKAYFFPHGMDQMFGDPNYPILHVPGALVAGTIMTNPTWRAKYREKMDQLMPFFTPTTKLFARIDEINKRIQPVIAGINKQTENEYLANMNNLKERISAREKVLVAQNAIPDPKPFLFDANGIAVVTAWEERKETDDAVHERVTLPNEPKCLSIKAGPSGQCIASWRSRVILPAGTYRFAVKAKAEKIEAKTDQQGSGAGIRISGSQRSNKLEGTSDWKLLIYQFTIEQPQQEVELVAELRAASGQVLFQTDSMRLVKVKK